MTWWWLQFQGQLIWIYLQKDLEFCKSWWTWAEIPLIGRNLGPLDMVKLWVLYCLPSVSGFPRWRVCFPVDDQIPSCLSWTFRFVKMIDFFKNPQGLPTKSCKTKFLLAGPLACFGCPEGTGATIRKTARNDGNDEANQPLWLRFVWVCLR